MAPRQPKADQPGDDVFDWGEVFLAAIGEGKSPTDAAIEAGVSRQAPYARKWAHPEFAKAWEVALEVRTERLEAALYRRAVYGMVTSTTWEIDPNTGERVKTGEVRKYSDNTGVFLLKAYDRDRFGDQSRLDLSVSGRVTHAHTVDVIDGRQPVEFSADLRRRLAEELLEHDRRLEAGDGTIEGSAEDMD